MTSTGAKSGAGAAGSVGSLRFIIVHRLRWAKVNGCYDRTQGESAEALTRPQRVFMKGVGTARPQFGPAGVQESGDDAVPTPAIRLQAYALTRAMPGQFIFDRKHGCL